VASAALLNQPLGHSCVTTRLCNPPPKTDKPACVRTYQDALAAPSSGAALAALPQKNAAAPQVMRRAVDVAVAVPGSDAVKGVAPPCHGEDSTAVAERCSMRPSRTYQVS
jgi:hypothetical protein